MARLLKYTSTLKHTPPFTVNDQDGIVLLNHNHTYNRDEPGAHTQLTPVANGESTFRVTDEDENVIFNIDSENAIPRFYILKAEFGVNFNYLDIRNPENEISSSTGYTLSINDTQEFGTVALGSDSGYGAAYSIYDLVTLKTLFIYSRNDKRVSIGHDFLWGTDPLEEIYLLTDDIKVISNEDDTYIETPKVKVDKIENVAGQQILDITSGSMINTAHDNTDDGDNLQDNGLILDGPADVDKQIVFRENGIPKWAIQGTWRGEKGEFFYLYNLESRDNILAISREGKWGINKPTNIILESASFVGTGINDMIPFGTYTKRTTSGFHIEIDGVSPDTFKWSITTDGVNFIEQDSEIPITTEPIELGWEVFITFGSTSGHVLGDKWSFRAHPQDSLDSFNIRPFKLESIFTYDGSTFQDVTYVLSTVHCSIGSNVPMLGTTSDILYIGSQSVFNSIYVLLDRLADNCTLVLEIWNGSTWVAIDSTNGLIDTTSNLSQNGVISWDKSTFTWEKTTVNSVLLYWIRLRTTTSSSIIATARAITGHGLYRVGIYAAYNDTRRVFGIKGDGITEIERAFRMSTDKGYKDNEFITEDRLRDVFRTIIERESYFADGELFSISVPDQFSKTVSWENANTIPQTIGTWIESSPHGKPLVVGDTFNIYVYLRRSTANRAVSFKVELVRYRDGVGVDYIETSTEVGAALNTDINAYSFTITSPDYEMDQDLDYLGIRVIATPQTPHSQSATLWGGPNYPSVLEYPGEVVTSDRILNHFQESTIDGLKSLWGAKGTEDNISIVIQPKGTGGIEFPVFPTTPEAAPTSDYEVANKKFIDDYEHDNLEEIKAAGDGIEHGHITDTSQTIFGPKTFDSIPKIPTNTPINDTDVASKKYVDDYEHDNTENIKLAGTGVTYGHINTGSQTIYGPKTFEEFPRIPTATPSENYHSASKKYVDDQIAGLSAPLTFKGGITLPGDFPTSAEVENGWMYIILSDVTDDDGSKTNTGQSFTKGDNIAWYDDEWVVIGSEIPEHDDIDGVKLAGESIQYGHISHLSQTIFGEKTFDEFPITPSSAPSSNYQTTNKKYVDDGLATKEPTLTKGNLTENTSDVLDISNGTNVLIGTGTTIKVKKATNIQDGYLDKDDWSAFNDKWDYDENTIKGVKVNNATDTDTVNGLTVETAVPEGAIFTDTTYTSSNFSLSNLFDVNNANKTLGTILKVDEHGNHVYVVDETGTDEKVKYDSEDPTAGYLEDKVIAGDGIDISEGIGGNANKLVITNTDKGSDISLPIPSDDTPEDHGIADPGYSDEYARADHVHNSDNTDTTYDVFDETTNGLVPASGTTEGRFLSDSGWEDIIIPEIPDIPQPSTSNPQDHGIANPGTIDDYSRADHVHNSDAITDTFSLNTDGLVPGPPTHEGKFLRDDGSWQEVEAGGLSEVIIPIGEPETLQPGSIWIEVD